MTFKAKSGNVALVKMKGERGNARVLEILWNKPPSRKDMRQFDDWFVSVTPDCGIVLSRRVENNEARAAEIDSILYGGPRN